MRRGTYNKQSKQLYNSYQMYQATAAHLTVGTNVLNSDGIQTAYDMSYYQDLVS